MKFSFEFIFTKSPPQFSQKPAKSTQPEFSVLTSQLEITKKQPPAKNPALSYSTTTVLRSTLLLYISVTKSI